MYSSGNYTLDSCQAAVRQRTHAGCFAMDIKTNCCAGAGRTSNKGMMTSSFPATNLARQSAPARAVIGFNLPPPTNYQTSTQVAPLMRPEHGAASQQNGDLDSELGSPVTRPVMTQPGMTHQGPPALGRPSFVNTLTHKSSWIMPRSHRMPQSGALVDPSRYGAPLCVVQTTIACTQLPKLACFPMCFA